MQDQKTNIDLNCKKLYIKSIDLKNYRNFSNLKLEFNNDIITILGENGSGKTNILESISLLAAGKGLRSEKFINLLNQSQRDKQNHVDNYWSADYVLNSMMGLGKINFHFQENIDQNNNKNDKRNILFNGSNITPKELINLVKIIWLTPQMNDIFIGSATNRRKFFDRIIYNFDSNYLSVLNKYNYYVKERLQYLINNKLSYNQYHNKENYLLNKLEEDIATQAELIFQIKNKFIMKMQEQIDALPSNLKKIKINIEDLFNDEYTKLLSISENKKEKFISLYKNILQENRTIDAKSKRNKFGIHKLDWLITYISKKMSANLCSTGEQKAMLITILIAQIELIKSELNVTPIILLDEFFVHLDENNIKHLASYIIDSKIQCFITAINKLAIEQITNIGQNIDINLFSKK